VQLCETFGNKSQDPDKPELITYADVTPSCQCDNAVTVPVINNLKARKIQPEQLETDATFTSSEVIKAARELGTDVNGPVMGSKDLPKETAVTLGDFTVDLQDPENSRCPAGHVLSKQTVEPPVRQADAAAVTPLQQTVAAATQQIDAAAMPQQGNAATASATRRISLAMVAAVCLGCEMAKACPTKTGRGEHKGERVIKTTEDDLICAQRRRYETTDEFRERQANRAGIEATNSEMKRTHGLRKLTVRGKQRVKVAVYLKALACNVKRVAVYLGKKAVANKPRRKATGRAAPRGAAPHGPNPTSPSDSRAANPSTL
jgi:hypothetical protein